MPTVLEKIATWTAGPGPKAAPSSVRRVVLRSLIDTIGVAIAGSPTVVANRARALARRISAPGDVTVLGSRVGLSPPYAAFANAVAAHALDFDDNSYAGVVHGSAVIVPAALAMAECTGAQGSALVDAIIAGSEAEYVIGQAIGNELYNLGWWTTAVFGPVGAAAAAARLLNLDAGRTAVALSLAVAQASGQKAVFGSDAKALLCGRASEAGLTAALLAKEGVTGPLDVFEHSAGFAWLFSGQAMPSGMADDIGVKWRLLEPGLDVKRIPVCLSSHAAVDAVLQLVRQHKLSHDDIGSIFCNVPPVVTANLTHNLPVNKQQAQFSMNFAIAVSILHPDFGLKHLSEKIIEDEVLRALMERASMGTGSEWDDEILLAQAPEGAFVRIITCDGRILEAFRAVPRGSAADPLSDDEISAKYLACCQFFPKQLSQDILENLLNIDRLFPVKKTLELISSGFVD